MASLWQAVRGVCAGPLASAPRALCGASVCFGRVQRRHKFTPPPSYVFGKSDKAVKPPNRVVRIVYRRSQRTAPMAKLEPYNRELKAYEYKRLVKLDHEDRMREALAEAKAKKQSEKESKELLKNTAPPRQQTVEIRNFTHSPRKVNNYARLVRRMSAKDAVLQLKFLQHAKAARVVLMCLESAMKNARVNQGIDAENLWISHSYCGPGAKNKKEIDIKGRGRYGMITHRKSHYFLVLEEGQPPKKTSKFIPKNVLTRWVHDRPAPFIQAAS